MNTKSIIQWNCNGFYSHKGEIDNISNIFNSKILCIQETRFKYDHVPKSKQFEVHFKNFNNPNIACNGVANYIHKSIECKQFNLNTTLQAVAS